MKKVFIVESDETVSKSIQSYLESKDYHVLDTVKCYKTAIKKLKTIKPEIILCSVKLNEEKSGIDLINELPNANTITCIFIATFSEIEKIELNSLIKCNKYLIKPFSDKQLFSIIDVAINQPQTLRKPTKRELCILKLLAIGKCSQQIAVCMNISFNTVETHRKNMLKRYYAHTTAELICLATSKGWISYWL